MYWKVLILSTLFGIWLGQTSRIKRLWKVLPVVAYLIIVGATSLWKNDIVSATVCGLIVGPLLSLHPFARALFGRLDPQAGRRGQRNARRQRRTSGGRSLTRNVNQAGVNFRNDLRGIRQRYHANRRPRHDGREE